MSDNSQEAAELIEQMRLVLPSRVCEIFRIYVAYPTVKLTSEVDVSDSGLITVYVTGGESLAEHIASSKFDEKWRVLADLIDDDIIRLINGRCPVGDVVHEIEDDTFTVSVQMGFNVPVEDDESDAPTNIPVDGSSEAASVPAIDWGDEPDVLGVAEEAMIATDQYPDAPAANTDEDDSPESEDGPDPATVESDEEPPTKADALQDRTPETDLTEDGQ